MSVRLDMTCQAQVTARLPQVPHGDWQRWGNNLFWADRGGEKLKQQETANPWDLLCREHWGH